jgi:hypothetical protein
MITQGDSWPRMQALAQRARLAGARRQRLDVRLSPEESVLLADVLEAAMQFMAAVTGRPELDGATPTSAELSYLAMEGGGFRWLAEEPELYSDGDLQERFEWTTASNAGR